jgi:hypothetical protein
MRKETHKPFLNLLIRKSNHKDKNKKKNKYIIKMKNSKKSQEK